MTELTPNKLYKAGETIFSEGDTADEGLFYLCYGDVEISRNEFAQERLLAKLAAGGVFGEMGIVTSAPRNATIRALTDCGCYTITKEQFQQQVKQLDPVMRGVFRCFALTIRDFIAQQDMWAQQLQVMMQQLQDSDPTTPGGAVAGSAQANEEFSAPSGNLADGAARKMTY